MSDTAEKANTEDAGMIPAVSQPLPEELKEKLYTTLQNLRPGSDITAVQKAVEIAENAHKDQKRKSGEPYVIHPLCVAIILAELEMDNESIIAGLLHDVVEDTPMTLDEVRTEFGSSVASLVDGVTKLTRLSWDGDKIEKQAENLRKMFLAMAKDIRVIIIKLADRTHNMRTLQYMSPEKQKEKARETLDIFAPLASRLGISRLKVELDNLALSYLEPEKYRRIVEEVEQRKLRREEFIDSIVREVHEHLENAGVECDVYGRIKHYFSIYKKMLVQHKNLDEIYDLFAVRVLVNTVQDCYAALGIIHEMYTPVPGRFKDYIATPKPNRYQSLHTTLLGKNGIPFEIQIRTYEMHKVAEYGIAAHWKYKEGNTSGSTTREEEKLAWLRQILEWQKDMSDNGEFLDSIKDDLDIFSETVFCFTPEGDVKNLPKGSTPVDFAYSIHSAVGNRMVGARVNDKLVPIDYEIQTGDRVEIITSMNSRGPSRDWLNIVKSTQARTKINQWFRSQNREDNIQRGKELLERYSRAHNLNYPELTKPEYVEKVRVKYNFRDWDSVLAAVGHGGLKEGQVINRLVEEKKRDEKGRLTDEDVLRNLEQITNDHVIHRQNGRSGIVVEGLNDLAVHFSRCCNPIPGDEIVGFVTRGRGISIHRTDCENIVNLSEIERARLISAEWAEDFKEGSLRYDAQINVYAMDRIGLVADISRVMAEQELDVMSVVSKVNHQHIATMTVKFRTSSVDDVTQLMARIRQIDGVRDVQRTLG